MVKQIQYKALFKLSNDEDLSLSHRNEADCKLGKPYEQNLLMSSRNDDIDCSKDVTSITKAGDPDLIKIVRKASKPICS
jgi:hypothetical protein